MLCLSLDIPIPCSLYLTTTHSHKYPLDNYTYPLDNHKYPLVISLLTHELYSLCFFVQEFLVFVLILAFPSNQRILHLTKPSLCTPMLVMGLLGIPCPLSVPMAPPTCGVHQGMLQAIGDSKLVNLIVSPTKAVSVVLVLMAPRMLLPGVM